MCCLACTQLHRPDASAHGLHFMRQNMRRTDSKYTTYPSRGHCSHYIVVVSSVVFLKRRLDVSTCVLFAASSSPAAASPQASAQVSGMSPHRLRLPRY